MNALSGGPSPQTSPENEVGHDAENTRLLSLDIGIIGDKLHRRILTEPKRSVGEYFHKVPSSSISKNQHDDDMHDLQFYKPLRRSKNNDGYARSSAAVTHDLRHVHRPHCLYFLRRRKRIRNQIIRRTQKRKDSGEARCFPI
jgi:hypothetical protein